MFNPLPIKRFDLVHAFNRLPLGNTPYVIGFESHLPRAYGLERSSYFAALRRSLAGPRCRRIVAISHHAEIVFRHMHQESPEFPELEAKLELRHPNVDLGDFTDCAPDIAADGPVQVAFVGAHFARKGGCVAVRLAELAQAEDLPIAITIVSTLEMGGGIWTDPIRAGYYDGWRRRIAHPSITHIDRLSNPETLKLFGRSHFSLLPTFGDTFGYSAIEAMQTFCPVIGTQQGALPEFIENGRNGWLLPLETSDLGEWVKSSAKDRDTEAFERFFSDEVERLAEASLAIILSAKRDPAAYRATRQAARQRVIDQFDSRPANEYWDALYEDAASGRRAGIPWRA